MAYMGINPERLKYLIRTGVGSDKLLKFYNDCRLQLIAKGAKIQNKPQNFSALLGKVINFPPSVDKIVKNWFSKNISIDQLVPYDEIIFEFKKFEVTDECLSESSAHKLSCSCLIHLFGDNPPHELVDFLRTPIPAPILHNNNQHQQVNINNEFIDTITTCPEDKENIENINKVHNNISTIEENEDTNNDSSGTNIITSESLLDVLEENWRGHIRSAIVLLEQSTQGKPSIVVDTVVSLLAEADALAGQYIEATAFDSSQLVEEMLIAAQNILLEDYTLAEKDIKLLREAWLAGLQSDKLPTHLVADAIDDIGIIESRLNSLNTELVACLGEIEEAKKASAMARAQQLRTLRNKESELRDHINTEMSSVIEILHQKAIQAFMVSTEETAVLGVKGPEQDQNISAIPETETADCEPPDVESAKITAETEEAPPAKTETSLESPVAEAQPAIATEEDKAANKDKYLAAKQAPAIISTPEEPEDYEVQPSSVVASQLLAKGAMSSSLVTSLLAEKNYSAAWMAADLCRRQGVNPPIDEKVIKALAVAPYINYSDGELVDVMRDLCSDEHGMNSMNFESLGSDIASTSFFVIAATMRPSLIAPQSGASALLENCRPVDADGVYKLMQVVARFGNGHNPLDLRVLKKISNNTAWEDEMRKIADNASRWLEDAANYKIKYVPATKVWLHWTVNNGMIHQAIALVTTANPDNLPLVEAELKNLTNPSFVDAKIQTTDEVLRPVRTGSSMDIDYDAKKQLRGFVAEACNHLRNFKAVVENRPGKRSTFAGKQVDKLNNDMRTCLPAARRCLEETIARHNGIGGLLAVSAEACLDAVTDLEHMFDPDAPTSFAAVSPRLLLHKHTLFTPEMATDDNWEPDLSVNLVGVTKGLLSSLQEQRVSLDDAYTVAVQQKQHTVTGRIIEIYELEGKIEKAEELRADRADKITDCRKWLKNTLDDYSKKIGELFNYGGIEYEQYNASVSRISVMSNSLDRITDFAACEYELAMMDVAMKEREAAARDKLAKRLEALDLVPDSAMYRAIRQKLDSNDLAMAEDYILRADKGETLQEDTEQEDIFVDFARRRLPMIESYFQANKNPSIVMDLKRGVVAGGESRLEDETKAAKIFEDYCHAGRTTQFTNDDDIKKAINALGFEADFKTSQNYSRSDAKTVRVKATPINNRDICPISMYGSKAAGEYRFALLYGTPYEDDIIRAYTTAQQNGSGPIIVLVFGVVKESLRKKLARYCRENSKTFLVIDNMLVYAAATTQTSMLTAIFRLSIPWTYYKPYTEGGGAIAEEMFYGRQDEITHITSSSEHTYAFIYGGRQLGKTALLDKAAKVFNNGTNHHAIYIDLLALGLGLGQPPEVIWEALARELKSKKIIGETNPNEMKNGQFLDRVKVWLEDDSTRRILLLLDEADGFLNDDGRDNFAITGKLKSYKERTGNRFHVVFSGLHNVKRTTDAKNDPLVQLGKDKGIGPLLSLSERRDAMKLIREPMAACGYYFESRELVDRIMFQALFSPSLIQIFCSKIINYVNSNLPAYDAKTGGGPPYFITERHVTEAYRTQEVRDEIVYRFNKTLALDERYEVIACIIANDMLEKQGRQRGYDVAWLRNEARKYWPAGFSEYTGAFDQFKVLLKEMEGLGVLTCSEENDTYTFRTSAITTVLGTPTAIQERLIRDRKEPLAYTPQIFRPTIETRGGVARLAPLSIIDLRAICCKAENSVVVVTGTEASGIDTIANSMKAVDDGHVIYRSPIDSQQASAGVFRLSDFKLWLADEIKKRRTNTTVIMTVPPNMHWDDEWIKEARSKLDDRKSATHFIKILFIGKPDNITYLMKHNNKLPVMKEKIYRCLPWHSDMVKRWAEDCHGPHRDKHYALIYEQTGGWPNLLLDFKKQNTSAAQWKENLENICAFKDQDGNKKRLAEFGINQAADDFTTLVAFASYGSPVTPEELAMLIEDVEGEQEMTQTLDWAYLTGIASRETDGRYIINSTVARLLLATSGQQT